MAGEQLGGELLDLLFRKTKGPQAYKKLTLAHLRKFRGPHLVENTKAPFGIQVTLVAHRHSLLDWRVTGSDVKDACLVEQP